MRVKICGITRIEDAQFAEKAGADAIGVVMFSPSSPRSVHESKAREIFGCLGPFVTGLLLRTRSQKQIWNVSSPSGRDPDLDLFAFPDKPGVRVLW